MTISHWIISQKEDYLILFGGRSKGDQYMKNIFILDLKEMKVYSSKKKLWAPSFKLRIIFMANDKNDTLLAGFIRNVSKEYDMNVPSELFQIFEMYHVLETIYVYEDGVKMIMIELGDILKDKDKDLTIEYFESYSESD